MSAPMSLRAHVCGPIGQGVGGPSLDVRLDTEGGVLALLGPNGAGKSSLLLALLGALPMAQGRVALVGGAEDVVLWDAEAGLDVPLEDRRIGWVPQGLALLPHLDVVGNIAFALGCQRPALTHAERAARVAEAVEVFELHGLARRAPATLSGGERQRVALARALALRPRALLLDEPLSALDVGARADVRALLARQLRRAQIPAILVTHDLEDATSVADRLLVMEHGRVAQCGRWAELVAAPATGFVRRLVDSAPGHLVAAAAGVAAAHSAADGGSVVNVASDPDPGEADAR